MFKKKLFSYFILYLNFFIYALSSLFLKLASGHTINDIYFFVYYACAILMIFIYAILWQQVLKRFSLSFAYGNRAIIIPLGLLWGYIVFLERVSLSMLIGTVIILLGVVLVAGDTNE